ncbi:unnamed protein product, partial [Allacma fusca]
RRCGRVRIKARRPAISAAATRVPALLSGAHLCAPGRHQWRHYESSGAVVGCALMRAWSPSMATLREFRRCCRVRINAHRVAINGSPARFPALL